MEVRAYQSYVKDSSLNLPLASLAPRLVAPLNGYFEFMTVHCADMLDPISRLLLEKMRKVTSRAFQSVIRWRSNNLSPTAASLSRCQICLKPRSKQ